MSSDKATLDFIEDYRSHPVLWDSSDKRYTNKIKRNEAYEAIGQKYNMSVKSVKTKIKNLRSYFSKEQRKIYVKISGATTDDKYETPWFAYKSLLFIGDSLTPRCLKDSLRADILRNKEDTDLTEDDVTENQDGVSSAPQPFELVDQPHIEVTATGETATSGAEESFALPLKTSWKAKRKRDDDQKKEDQAYSFLEIAAKELTSKDDCTVFGQLVACQLRKLTPRNQAIAKNRIQNLLFGLEIEQMDATPSYVTIDDAIGEASCPSTTLNEKDVK